MNISFHLDNPAAAVAGSTLSGQLRINATKEISAKRLEFSFRSEESTKVKYTTSGSGTHGSTRRTHYAYESAPLYHYNIPVDQNLVLVHGKIRPGDYALPFSFVLPASLPETMSIAAHGGYAKIDHGFKATFKGSGFFSNYKNTMEVYVRGMPGDPNQTLPFLQEPTMQKISKCCFRKGEICFGAKIADTQLVRGQSVTIDMSCVNNTTVAIERVYSKLNQHVAWKARGHGERTKQQLCSTDFGRLHEMQAKDRASLKLKASQTSTTGDRAAAGYANYADQQRVLREIQDKVHSRTLQAIPHTALLTYSGRLVTVTHQISLRLRTGSCISDAKIHVPVKVAPASMEPHAVVVGGAPAVVAAGVPPPPATNPSYIPFASAVPIGTTNPTPTTVPGFAMGSLAVQQAQQVSGTAEDDIYEPDILIEAVGVVPSLEQLLVEMENSTDDLTIIRSKLNNPEWNLIFECLQATDFGNMLSKIDIDFNQVSVAELVAPRVRNFTCEYIIVALRKVADWNRSNIVEKLVPYCTDFAENKDTILRCLTDWEKMVTQRVFDNPPNNNAS